MSANTTPETALTRNPEDNNFLNPNNFRFILKRAPTLNFFLQRISFPGVQVVGVAQPTPFAAIYQPGDNIAFNPLTITFRVDENLKNYMELFKWMNALGLGENFWQYKKLKDQPSYTGKGIISDIVVTILDAAKNPNYNFYFHDCFPISLSDMIFDVTPQNINHQVATATFRFTDYDIEEVVKPVVES